MGDMDVAPSSYSPAKLTPIWTPSTRRRINAPCLLQTRCQQESESEIMTTMANPPPSQALQMKRKMTRWEKITVVSANVCGISILGLMAARLLAETSAIVWPYYVALVFYVISTEYLVTYALWHWRTRYAGSRPFAWAGFFVISAFAVPALCYYAYHIRSDIRQEGPYAPNAPKPEPLLPLPPKYEVVKSLCFVGGWFCVYWAVLVTTVGILAFAAILTIYAQSIQASVPKEITQKVADLLRLSVYVWASSLATLYMACGAAIAGAGLLYASQRMKWRLATEGTPELQEWMQSQPAASSESKRRFLFRVERYFRKPAWIVGKVAAGIMIFLVGLGVTLWFLITMSNEPAATKSSASTEKSIVIAFGDLASGTILTTNNLARSMCLLTNCPPSFIEADQFHLILGRPINRPIKHAHLIYWPDLLPAKK
jgi:hypothetical protein